MPAGETTTDGTTPTTPVTPQPGKDEGTQPTTPATPATNAAGAGEGQEPPTFATFDDWLKAQPDDVKDRIDDYTHGLKSGLDAERNARKNLEKELKAMRNKSDEGSDLRKTLDDVVGKLAQSNRQADFYDKAHLAGATNLRLLYLAASDAGLVDDKGAADFDGLKARYPELFAKPQTTTVVKPVTSGQAGNGTQNVQTPVSPDMNQYIRRQAGIN